MKRIIVSLIALIATLIIIAIPVAAEISLPQVFSWQDEIARDWNGNPITDCWAYDPSQTTEKYVRLDSEGKLVEQKATFEVENKEAPKGWIKFQAVLPENLKGYTVVVGIAGPNNYEVKLYDINDYTLMQEVVEGTYRIEVAMISGDYKGEYPATFESEINVYANSTASVLKVDFTPKEVEEGPETIPEVEPEPIVEEDDGITLLQIIVLSLLAGIVGAGLFIFKKIKDNE